MAPPADPQGRPDEEQQGKRRIDPLWLFPPITLVVLSALVWFISRDRDEPLDLGLPDAGVSVDDGGIAALSTSADAGAATGSEPNPIAAIKPKTRRGKIVQRELEAQRLAKLRAEAAASAASDGMEVVVSPGEGSGALLKPFVRALRHARMVGSAARGTFVTLKLQTSGDGGNVSVKCSAALAELPNKKLVASLRAEAEAQGSASMHDELVDDATKACAESLAEDVDQWLRSRAP